MFDCNKGSLPIVIVLYVISFFAKPRQYDRRSMKFLQIHFICFVWSTEGTYVFWGIREKCIGTCLIHLGHALLLTIVFYYCLKLRVSISRLPDKDLHEFLIKILLKGGFKTTTSVLFILFRSFKCNIEMNMEACTNNAWCASAISVMLIITWILKLINRSIQSEWREELSISMEKVARMTISLRQAAEGLFLAMMAGCGAFLFALMSAKEPDWYLVTAVGLTGVLAGSVCLVSEIYSITNERNRRRAKSHLKEPGRASEVELVEACSW